MVFRECRHTEARSGGDISQGYRRCTESSRLYVVGKGISKCNILSSNCLGKNGWFWPTEGNISGCDFAGVIEELGEGAPEDLHVGERVACWVHGCACFLSELLELDRVNLTIAHWRNGAFAEYVVCSGALALRIPESWTFEEAAQLPVACYTACLCLYYVNKFPTPIVPVPTPTTDLLVWAGSTSIGQYTIQLASQSGLRVLTTCSPRNFDLVKSFGATEAFDYNDPETPGKIRALTENKLVHVVDCISVEETSGKIASSIGDVGGEVVIVLPTKSPREDVRCKFILGYEIFGKVLSGAWINLLGILKNCLASLLRCL